MNSLKIPNRLNRDPYIKALKYKSKEDLPLVIGRLVLLIDSAMYQASNRWELYKLEEVVHWDRSDISYAECLEFAAMGEICKDKFILRIPRQWANANQQYQAAKKRVANAMRNDKGQFVSRQQKPILCDAEGNEI